MNCPSCRVMMTNGRRCHETGCPDAWRDLIRKCRWCGSDFTPASAGAAFCDDSCYRAYYGMLEEE
jgi:hypothetical protein